MMRRGLILVMALAACGGKIAPVDTFDDKPIDVGPLPTSTPTSTPPSKPLPIPKPTKPPPPITTHPPSPPPIDKTDPPPNDSFEWQAFEFETDKGAYSKCAGGKKYVRPAKSYGLWVGVESCTPTMYKIYLGYARKGVFHEIADFSGHGQDHCELVNPKFTLPNEDEITSGSCQTCDIDSSLYDAAGSGTYVFDRGYYGGPFDFEPWPDGYYTAAWYACGVSIP